MIGESSIWLAFDRYTCLDITSFGQMIFLLLVGRTYFLIFVGHFYAYWCLLGHDALSVGIVSLGC